MADYVKTNTAIAFNNIQMQESKDLVAKVYFGQPKNNRRLVFDRVYCNFAELPASQKSFEQIFCDCFGLVCLNGLALISNIPHGEKADEMLSRFHLTKNWFLRETNVGFDLLFKKTHH